MPADLPAQTLAEALDAGWRFAADSLTYQPVGFGSHHWLAAAGDRRLFLTVDDLSARLWSTADTADAAFARLDNAFRTACHLHGRGLEFVVAPLRARDGTVLRRLSPRYSLVVHDYLYAAPTSDDGEFPTVALRRQVLGLLTRLHATASPATRSGDFAVPQRDELEQTMSATGHSWRTGPFAEPARELLAAHLEELALLLKSYDRLVATVSGRVDRFVVTHGEPNAGNVLTSTRGGLVFVDWESVLLAPPERDLWDLAGYAPELLAEYTATTGVALDEDALALYRMWYDLAEIAGYLHLFRKPHVESADSEGSWENLRHFMQPAGRWPGLV